MVPGRAPLRLTSVKTDVGRIKTDPQPCSHALTCTQSRPTMSRRARVTANTQPPSRRCVYAAICCPLSAAVTFEICHISPPQQLSHDPVSSILFSPVNNNKHKRLLCLCKHLSNNDGHQGKKNKQTSIFKMARKLRGRLLTRIFSVNLSEAGPSGHLCGGLRQPQTGAF